MGGKGGQKVWVRDARGEVVQTSSSVACLFPQHLHCRSTAGLFLFSPSS